ncbi:hypothetical protein MON41_21850 [Roseomonas vastitatis]|uniref:Tripartite tricarboxylate transporter family receptor n=1 Tax=Teichococcus vastitatis TaxID=2307076 RepID=A0ABS9WBN1_9PROT|nr:tripartite tricarboxylate transporter substrate-binding protein [Pseudoroseomonas vastitatis]MCI0756295.1 hypothetical protein [Pseudoroseomonas vastitatis]
MVIDSAATAIPIARSGQACVLGVTSAARLAQLPSIPTVAETLPGYNAYTWNAILARAGTAPEALDRMNAAVNFALQKPNLRKRLEDLGIAVMSESTPTSVDAFLRTETGKWQRLLREAGVKAD